VGPRFAPILSFFASFIATTRRPKTCLNPSRGRGQNSHEAHSPLNNRQKRIVRIVYHPLLSCHCVDEFLHLEPFELVSSLPSIFIYICYGCLFSDQSLAGHQLWQTPCACFFEVSYSVQCSNKSTPGQFQYFQLEAPPNFMSITHLFFCKIR
jgi:hypothetical protein